jgi:hypothetical protein
MNWDAIGAIGQAVSALALIIVIVQVRHARAETRRSMSQGRAAAVRELCMHKSGNELLNTANRKAHVALGGQDQDLARRLMDAGLTGEEVNAVVFDQFAFWHYRQASYLDELTAGERTEFEGGIRGSYGSFNVVGRLWYDTLKPTLNPDFVRYVDNLLAQPAATPS